MAMAVMMVMTVMIMTIDVVTVNVINTCFFVWSLGKTLRSSL